MTDYINPPSMREIWARALPALPSVKNGDYLSLDQLQRAFGLDVGRKLRDVLAADERDGLLTAAQLPPPTAPHSFSTEDYVR